MRYSRHQRKNLLLGLPIVAFFVAGEVLYALNQFGGEGAAFVEAWFLLISSMGVAAIGLLILHRIPGHRIGWVLYAIGFVLCFSAFLDEYAIYGLKTSPGAVPFSAEAATVEVVGALGFGLVAVFLFLVFPDGRLPSPRWQPVITVGCLAMVGILVSPLFRSGDLGGPFSGTMNPWGISGARTYLGVVSILSLVITSICGLFSLASLVMRFRRATGVERRQLEWVFLGGATLAVALLIAMPLRITGVMSQTVQSVLFSVGFTAIPVTMGIAILRYRLYDIGRVINRTIVYGSLTALLAVSYLGLVVGLQAVMRPVNGGSDLAIALTTLVVAALFLPARSRIQSIVDRRFNRRAYDAAETIERFGARLREDIEVTTLHAELLSLVSRTMEPERVSLWLRPAPEGELERLSGGLARPAPSAAQGRHH